VHRALEPVEEAHVRSTILEDPAKIAGKEKSHLPTHADLAWSMFVNVIDIVTEATMGGG
jgi:hypothetical protein